MGRVLLLNPPASGRPLLRDFSCGESAKADYYWAPVDLLVLSGVLAQHHDIEVLDAVVEGLEPGEALNRASSYAPETVFSLTAAVSLRADDTFLAQLKARTGARIFGIGDVASFSPREALHHAPAFDGMVQNFADPSLVELAAGVEASVGSVTLRCDDGVDIRPIRFQTPLSYPLPRHQLFPLARYRMPFTEHRGCTSIITAYGCPFKCSFCASGNLPWQLREVDAVLEELTHVASLGVPEVYLRDFTFGPTRTRARELCRRMTEAKLGLSWSAECRIEVLDPPLLDQMREAGCEVILCGIETGTDEVARRLGKRMLDSTEQILEHARTIGIRTCAHFVMGTPGETETQLKRTISYARKLPLDYAAFNLYAPRLGTQLREELIQGGRVNAEDFDGQDVSFEANAYAGTDAPRLRWLHRWAVLSFYFRPRQLARLLTCTPWGTLVRQGSSVVHGVLGS